MGLREQLFSKFIFPRTLLINVPGIITGKSVNRLGMSSSKTRAIFFFEDMFVDLYFLSLEKIGKENTQELWYKIGKDIGIRYFLFSNNAFHKYDDETIFLILKQIFEILSAIGLSFAESVMPNSNKNLFCVEGKQVLVSRKINDGSFLAGLLSGILSFVYHENIEAKCVSCSAEYTKIIASKNIDPIYFPDYSELAPKKNYDRLNFSFKVREDSERKLCSLSDLIKFNKIYFHDETNNWMFYDKAIFPSEIGLFGVILSNYMKEGFFHLIEESYKNSGEKIFSDLLKKEVFLENRIKFLLNVLSGFGWGIPHLINRKNEIVLKFEAIPFSCFGPMDRAIFVNGVLNIVFGKKVFLKKILESEFVYEY